ncbi:MAG: hypothetical protein COU33_00780 [Candidatus Magasanikbacteria bacterium CG10_big_fil_rev_8_21_14_0_10_43_6]|uniref:Fibronectin type-III domain-containing protein n=1 Tax=Candidatus Magasanikbacteria bacterium CG10_big_fil_rev_8_21_14_0_10_43_6 TaxID=1974650 RepID=A0A2M6W2C9_9BACT|nr:MAG: hypothetical protein COU33_00780 [Candidatus Magasanikbacteria bacterium CG10_big_fil_rev_8_21_14_0_10_43_6]
MFALLLLVGGGCAPKDDYSSTDTNAETGTEHVPVTKNAAGATTRTSTTEQHTDFVLTAEPTGDRTVAFSWTLPDELAAQAEKFMVVRGTTPNPEHPATWWWWRGASYRNLEWSELPLGEAHFRVCAIVEDNCIAYSNDIVVEVE